MSRLALVRLSKQTTTTVLLFPAVAAVFAATAHWSISAVDAMSATLPAWHLATYGNANLDAWYHWAGWPKIEPHGWLVAGHGGHWVSNRTPGVVLLAVPAYWLLGRGGAAPSLLPGVLTSVLVAAAAVAMLHRVFLKTAPPKMAMGAALVAAFATSTWTITGSELWPHAPDMLLLAGAMWALSVRREWTASLLLGAGVVTRPYLAVAAAFIGIGMSIARRDVRSALRIGTGSLAGLAGLLLWNHHFFLQTTVRGGYDAYATSTDGVGGHQSLINIAGVLVSPSHGILVYSPFLIALLPVVWRGWRSSQDWVRVAATAGVATLAVQLHQNSYTGGSAFYGYRVPLECLTLCAPLLVASYQAAGQPLRRVTKTLVVVSTSLTALGAFLFPYPGYPGLQEFSRWEPGYVLASYPGRGLAVLIGVGVAATIVTILLSRERRAAAEPERPLAVRIAHARGQLALD